jgi:hypothetical protein
MAGPLPTIEDFLPVYPRIESDDYETDIWKKQEIYALRGGHLTADITRLKPGSLLKTQEAMKILMSPHTTYNGFLVYYDVGMGKTCASVAVAENFRQTKSRALVIVKGPQPEENFKYELTQVCTCLETGADGKCSSGKYLPPLYDEGETEPITKKQFVGRRNKLINESYKITTFEKFASRLMGMTDAQMRISYSNRVIIIDEAHNLRTEQKMKIGSKSVNIRKQIFRLLHSVTGSKVLLLSATPMYDRVEEIASIMNLLLPIDDQMLTKAEFRKRYIGRDVDGDVELMHEDELTSYFRGRVTYVQGGITDVKRIDMGERNYGMKYLKTVLSLMSDFQADIYLSVLDVSSKVSDDPHKEKGLLKTHTQIQNFVYADGSYGSKGFNKNVRVRGRGANITYLFDRDTETLVKSDLGQLSKKFLNLFNKMEARPTQLCFIFSELSKAGGAIQVSMALRDHLGYTEIHPGQTDNKEEYFKVKNRRYALITDKTTPSQMDLIFSIYRDPRNRYGEYMFCLVGSKIVGEARSFKNVRQVHVLDPHFNNSSTEQAIGRAIRMFSHLDLPEAERFVEVFRHASVLSYDGRRSQVPLKNLAKSVGYDMRMYQLSENKDVEIRSITRLIKEINPLCPIFRSDIGDEDSRQCDYRQCEYQCTQIEGATPDYVLPDVELDKSSYRLYYSESEVRSNIEYITFLFKLNSEYTLQELVELLEAHGSDDMFVLIKSLLYVIQGRMVFHDRFNIPRYLKHQGDLYYLSDQVSGRPGDSMMGMYISEPRIDDSLSFNDSLTMSTVTDDLLSIGGVRDASPVHLVEIIDQMDDDVKVAMIEAAVVAMHTDGVDDDSRARSRAITEAYDDQIRHVGGEIYHNIGGADRCFVPGVDCEFKDCKVPDVAKTDIRDAIARVRDNRYKVYGVVSADKKGKRVFKVANLLKHEKAGEGIVCNTGGRSKIDLIDILRRVEAKLSRDESARVRGYSTDQLKSTINRYKGFNVSDEDDRAKLEEMYVWGKYTKSRLCEIIEDRMRRIDILVE